MGAPVWNIVLEEDSDFDLTVRYKSSRCTAVNVTGYGARFGVRNDPDAPALVIASVSGGQITVAGTTGDFNIHIGAATVNSLKYLVEDTAEYSLTIFTAANTETSPKRILQGHVDFSRNYGGS